MTRIPPSDRWPAATAFDAGPRLGTGLSSCRFDAAALPSVVVGQGAGHEENCGPGIDAAGYEQRRIVAFDPASRGRKPKIRATAMVFEDPQSQRLQADLDRLAPSDATVLIIGETGTGKELVSRYIHSRSRRADGPFVAVNCGAFTDTLAEAELFGFEKGAFTGALKTQAGWFEAAHGGTLLLDEIGDLPPALQVKLLRVLQEREVVRVGSRKAIPIDVRVIAATNVDLEAAVEARRFREDLYFRLNVASVRLAPLRERPGDIPPLAEHFLDLHKERLGRPELSLSAEALRRLSYCPWPGNIRQLENVLHNAVLLAPGPEIGADDVRLRCEGHGQSQGRASGAVEPLPCDVEGAVKALVARAIADGEPDLYERLVRTAVRSAFELAEGNQMRAAESLGMTRNAFRTQLAHLGAIAPRRRPGAAEPGEERLSKLSSPPPALRPAQLVDLPIGYQKFGTSSILKMRGAVERRLAVHGYRVTWTEFVSGPQMMDALGSMQVEFVATGEAPPVFAQAAGVPLVYVGYDPPAPNAEALLVRRDSPFRSTADLRGRTVALHTGSNVHYFLLRALQAYGLTLDDVRIVHMQPAAALEALLDEMVDAWAIWDPLLSSAQIRDDTRVLTDGSGLVPNHQFYLANQSFADRNPEAVAILLDEVGKAGEYAALHAAEAARSMTRDLGIAAPALELAFSRLTYGAKPLDDRAVRRQQAVADSFHASGLLKSSISVREAVWSGAWA
ncbi:aliphatic sulfonates family ABC transporter substrate-binding protein [Azospirillum lipoferum]|uniref:Putative aliphatic sulfonates-binding protein n=1 Tax=Azospirillum lipoferum TaxID=193 RepID=A0A5A9GLB8_AZOLI|nr:MULTISPECIES: aliphatic sulfonate ABC transporter substrate-binding protein [Azospirillum]KAA0594552.1 aliphatic sulfonate ABC transporter substrate-binding protein [Azospirillum lipoferum]MCP1613311.1 aliphatic sulfonates family ABC transporter substrate-binding protein [Azospirillum lipoferum]MDW5531511.1 aliphatic sulfonate ABC transporter substrate-binding protein [Azospirillum sp. NL1]